jgi:capsular exopolysaccharide synthesis family protein
MTLLPTSPVSPSNANNLQPSPAAVSPYVSTPTTQTTPSGGFDIWGPLQRRKYLIALFSIIGAIFGYFYYINCPKVYSSNALLMITTQAPPSVMGSEFRADKDSLDKHASLIGSELVLRNASDRGNFDNMRSFADSNYPVGSLKEMLRVVPISKETLSIVCNGPDPDELPSILNEIIASYRNEIEEDSKTDGQIAKQYIEQVSDKLSDDKEDAETERSNLWAQLGIESTDNQGNVINPHNKKLFRLQDQHDSIRHTLRDVQDRARLLAKSLKVDPETGVIDDTQIKISAIEAQDYLKLTRGIFKEEALGGDRVVRNLQPDLQRRQALEQKIWDHETRLTDLRFERSKLSDVFGKGHKSIAAIDNQLEYYATQKADFVDQLEKLESYIEKEARQMTSSDSAGDSQPKDLETFRADEDRQWIRMYQLKLQQEQSRLLKTLGTLENEIATVSKKARAVANGITKLNLLQHQIDKKGEAVSVIVNKLSEIDILSNDKYSTTDVKVLNTPKRGGKIAPSLPKSLALGTMLASLLGLGLAILVDQSELAFRNPTEIFQRLQVPVVGRIPRINIRQIEATQGHSSLIAAHKPSATASESFRDVRTGLFFRSNVDDIKTILFTSPSPGDGKSTTIANMAISIAQAGKKVCLVDADFRRPRVHQYFGQELTPGLMDILSGKLELDDAIQDCILQDDLYLLPAGGRPKNPGELVTSQEFRNLIEALREKFDYVLIDSPPVLPVSDPATIASIVDGVYLVTRIRKGVKLTSQKAKETLDRVGANWMGVIVNGLDENPHYSEYGYQYGAYSYYGGVYGRYYDSNSKVYRDKIAAK